MKTEQKLWPLRNWINDDMKPFMVENFELKEIPKFIKGWQILMKVADPKFAYSAFIIYMLAREEKLKEGMKNG